MSAGWDREFRGSAPQPLHGLSSFGIESAWPAGHWPSVAAGLAAAETCFDERSDASTFRSEALSPDACGFIVPVVITSRMRSTVRFSSTDRAGARVSPGRSWHIAHRFA
jgi:hypothetical protein